MSSADGSSPPPLVPRHAPPHIRLNSGSGEDLLQDSSQYQQQARPQTSRQQSSRSLITNNAPRPGTAPRSPAPGAPGGTPLYQSATPAESTELLLPPRKSKTRRFRDDDSLRSPTQSRRTSWSSGSDGSRDSRNGAFVANPFTDESRAPSRAGSEDEGVNTQTVSEKFNIMPSAGLLLFPEDVEKDDWLHTPDPNDRDKMQWSDLFSKRGLVNVGGLAFITIGLLVLFIGYPILTFVQRLVEPNTVTCAGNPNCISAKQPLLQNVRQGLIDPDTPSSAMSRKGANGQSQTLVFSDEFNTPGRTFYDGDDPYWQAVDIWYGATKDLEWYDPDAATTKDGYLNLQFDAFQNHGLNYRSGMMQSWNKLCYKGGYLEASISLPGSGQTAGFWPGFWAMGNLGRPGYMSTTDGMWPYSYHDDCDAGITPNQSDPSGINGLPGMRLPACTCAGEDDPSPGISRSAPEIDAIEATVTWLTPPSGDGIGAASQSFQLAPFDIWYRPNTDFIEIYDRAVTMANSYEGGPYQQAISVVTTLNNEWYNDNAYQIYAFEYGPGSDGYITWYVGDTTTWTIQGKSIGPNGNIGQRVMPEEPMSVVVNFGMSPGFSGINWTSIAAELPATMRIDYVRIYQDEGSDGMVTCDPEGYETTPYILEHPRAYNNPNWTTWDAAGYKWPTNSFMNDCQAAGKTKKVKREEKEYVRRRSSGWYLPWS